MTDDHLLPKTVSFLRVGKRRLEIFQKACAKFGLTVVEHNAQHSTILVDDELDFISASKAIKISSFASPPVFIRTQWLSDSIKQNKLLSHQSYTLQANLPTPTPPVTETHSQSDNIEGTTQRSSVKRELSISSSDSDTDDESNAKKVFFCLMK